MLTYQAYIVNKYIMFKFELTFNTIPDMAADRTPPFQLARSTSELTAIMVTPPLELLVEL